MFFFLFRTNSTVKAKYKKNGYYLYLDVGFLSVSGEKLTLYAIINGVKKSSAAISTPTSSVLEIENIASGTKVTIGYVSSTGSSKIWREAGDEISDTSEYTFYMTDNHWIVCSPKK